MGAGGRRRSVEEGASIGSQARDGFGGKAQDNGREGRRRRGQVGLHQGGGADPGSACQGTRTSRGEDPRVGTERKITFTGRPAGGGAEAPPPVRCWCAAFTHAWGGGIVAFRTFVIDRHRHLKWAALDPVENVLMVL